MPQLRNQQLGPTPWKSPPAPTFITTPNEGIFFEGRFRGLEHWREGALGLSRGHVGDQRLAKALIFSLKWRSSPHVMLLVSVRRAFFFLFVRLGMSLRFYRISASTYGSVHLHMCEWERALADTQYVWILEYWTVFACTCWKVCWVPAPC